MNMLVQPVWVGVCLITLEERRLQIKIDDSDLTVGVEKKKKYYSEECPLDPRKVFNTTGS